MSGEKMVNLEIDGRYLQAREGDTVLDVARREGIPIPTICFHDALEAAGACRLCMVEITHADWGGWKGMVTSCLYPVEEGLQVTTDNDDIRTVRRTMLDLLLSRCSGSEFVQKLAAEHGVSAPTWRKREEETKCILCSLCVRVCAAKGCHAIAMGGRGIERVVARPFDLAPPDCIGCASCAHICPTGHIQYEDKGDVREIWGHAFEMARCVSCNRPVMPEVQLQYEARKAGLDESYFRTCQACSERKTVETIRSAFPARADDPAEAAG